MRQIGLHLRIEDSIDDTVERALNLQLPIFQCFFMQQRTKELILPDRRLVSQFKLWQNSFEQIFIHASYFINLASHKYNALRLLQREINLAKRLGCSHIVLHPGAASGAPTKQDGIDTLVRALNSITARERDITIVLENTAHGNLSIGSDVTDFRLLREKLDRPEKIKFCIDTAHAYSYGYDIKDQQGRHDFVALLENSIGIENIVVIHLNDTDQLCGSKVDKHMAIGHGLIGETALRHFVMHKQLENIPLILELPMLSQPQEDAMLQKVKRWHR